MIVRRREDERARREVTWSRSLSGFGKEGHFGFRLGHPVQLLTKEDRLSGLRVCILLSEFSG